MKDCCFRHPAEHNQNWDLVSGTRSEAHHEGTFPTPAATVCYFLERFFTPRVRLISSLCSFGDAPDAVVFEAFRAVEVAVRKRAANVMGTDFGAKSISHPIRGR